VNKKELDNLILNEIFGFGKSKSPSDRIPGLISKDSPLSGLPFDDAIKTSGAAKTKLTNLSTGSDKDKGQLQRIAARFERMHPEISKYDSVLKTKRQGALTFFQQLNILRKIRLCVLQDDNEIKAFRDQHEIILDTDFVELIDLYRELFPCTGTPAGSPVTGASPKALPPGAEAPRRDGEVTPVSGDIEEVPAGELRPVSGEIEEAPPAPKQAGASLQINPKMLSDGEYVSRFAELVKKYMLLEPKTEDESRRQVSKILDLKKQMNDLMKQGTPGARELQLAIRGELAPIQRKIQQVAENLVKQNFEQIIREELENYIKEKK